MRARPSPVLIVEILALVAWVGLATMLVRGRWGHDELVPLDVAALTTGPSAERWVGIFFQDQHVGFAVSRVTATVDGGTLYEERSSFRFATFGKLQEVVTAGAALTNAAGTLSRFDFFMASDAVRLSARGEIQGSEIVMEVSQGGETSELRFPITAPPQVSASLESVLQRQDLVIGDTIRVPFFDPVTMSQGEMQIHVDEVSVLENGEEAYWITRRFGDMESRALVLPTGETIREEGGALGLALVRMSAEEAQALPEGAEPVDLIALSAVHLDGQLPEARSLRFLELQIQGIDPSRVPDQPPMQRRSGDVVQIDVPLLEELPDLPVADRSEPAWLEATYSLPVSHPLIREKSAEVVGNAATRRQAVQRLVDFVYDYVEKVPVMGVPNGLEVLRTAQGDCNEHTALFVTLARAAGIPARIAAGVVYSDRVSETGAFYYHAWPEVRLGGPTDWVPVDPTFGQVPADATHLKLVEGDLERQVEIMGVMGRLALTVRDSR